MKLPKKITNELLRMPEQGMGYQKIDFLLENGNIVKDVIVLNCEIINEDLKIKKIIRRKEND